MTHMMNDDEDKTAKTVEELNKYGAQLHIVDVDNMQLLQFGTSNDENGNSKHWLKAQFKSGSTYLFTDDNYAQLMLNSINTVSKADNKTVASLVSDAVSRWLKMSSQNDQQLNEDEEVDADIKQAVKQRSEENQTKVVIQDLDLTEEQIVDKAKSIFKKFIDSVYTDDQATSLPVEWTTQFNEMFMTVMKPDGTYAKNEVPTNDCIEVQTVVNKLPLAFIRTGFAVNLKMNEWQLAFAPIAWSGMKCKSTPQNLDELLDEKYSIDNLEEISIRAENDMSDDTEDDKDISDEDSSTEDSSNKDEE